jgi:Leucine Rich repeat
MSDETAKPRRRWLRFSLRSFLLFVVVIGVPLEWLGWELHKVRQHRFAVAALEKAGCRVFDCLVFDLDHVSTVVPEWMERVLGEQVPRNVTVVLCYHSRVSDADLAYLRGMTHLRELAIPDTQVTDAGMENLQGLIRIKHLDLGRTQMTDAGLVYLAGLSRLQELFLNGTQVTDAGLIHLQGLNELELLDLAGTLVTDAGAQQLKKALPNCDILR